MTIGEQTFHPINPFGEFSDPQALTPGANTCYKIQMCVASTLLMIGGISITLGLPALITNLASATIEASGDLDIEALKCKASVHFKIDEAATYKNALITGAGIIAAFMSAGFLLGMAYRNPE